jgi:hypothetical protein
MDRAAILRQYLTALDVNAAQRNRPTPIGHRRHSNE